MSEKKPWNQRTSFPLLLIGMIGLFTLGSQLTVKLIQAWGGDKDNRWTPRSTPLSLDQTRDDVRIRIGGRSLRDHLAAGSLSAADNRGDAYRVVARDVRVRLNNRHAARAQYLGTAVITAVGAGASLALFGTGLFFLIRERAGGATRPGTVRKAHLMQVDPDKQDEYCRRHNPIWPELAETLRAHGVSRYSIFLDRETGRLFAYVEVVDEAAWNAIAETAICRRWWAWMKEIMPSHPDGSPVSRDLEEVFFLG